MPFSVTIRETSSALWPQKEHRASELGSTSFMIKEPKGALIGIAGCPTTHLHLGQCYRGALAVSTNSGMEQGLSLVYSFPPLQGDLEMSLLPYRKP